jgi:hypothetical protein
VSGGRQIHNDVAGTVAGALIQTGTFTGGLHVHPAAGIPVVPRQLPAPPRLFTGRAVELMTLTAELDVEDEPGAMVVISAIGGTGGIGKTSLALHWAHQNLDRFPDGREFHKSSTQSRAHADERMPPVAVASWRDGHRRHWRAAGGSIRP